MDNQKYQAISLKVRLLATLFSALFFLPSCVTTPKPYEGRQISGLWEAKAQARDLVSNKITAISLDITAATPAFLRLDVTGTLGINLATLVMKNSDVKYALYRQKKFYQGSLSDRALLPLFKMNLNPKLIMNICMDLPIDDEGWSCKIGNNNLVDSCERATDGLKILWSERNGEKKRVVVGDKNFELQIAFKSYTPMDQTKVESNKSPFQLEPPKDFTKYKIP